MSCVFCDIVAGVAPASFVGRDDLCTMFLAIQPINQGHLLVVPNAHVTNLADLDPAIGAKLFCAAQRAAAALRVSGVPCDGIDLFLADGAAAGQSVFHVHLHVIPRRVSDGFGFTYPPRYHDKPPRHELDGIASMIRAVLA